MKHPRQTFLDGKGRCCSEENALLLSTVSQLPILTDGDFEKESKHGWATHQTNQTVQIYGLIMGVLAEADSAGRIAKPIGQGICIGEQKVLSGYRFYRSDLGAWEYETATCKIEIQPDADQSDVESWLQTFREIESKIIDRGISGGKITFELGGNQYDPERKVVAQAIASQNLIRFPSAANGQHLLAVCLENGTKKTAHEVSLQGIMLHEIGHILEAHLSKEAAFLKRAMAGKLEAAADALKTISPNYLGKSVERTAKNLKEALNSATMEIVEGMHSLYRVDGPKMEAAYYAIKIGGKDVDSETFLHETVEEYGDEIFAETVRHYYLEPALTGKIPDHSPTGWKGFDELAAVLQREARYTLRNKKGGGPLFPEKRKQPCLIPEIIQDMLS